MMTRKNSNKNLANFKVSKNDYLICKCFVLIAALEQTW